MHKNARNLPGPQGAPVAAGPAGGYTPPMRPLLLTALAAVLPAAASAQGDSTRLLRAAREIVAEARYAALVTVAGGAPEARTVDPLLADTGFRVWIATNPKTRKVREIAANPRVALYWFGAKTESYVTLKGRARLVTEAAERTRRWKAEWTPFYPDRRRVALIVVEPETIEVVSPARGVVGDSLTWRPPAVRWRAPRP